ncbi:LuxR C-terminal-related transcriptional regulator [Nocardia sp. NPDC052254]|uniref:ATP-binding protein n=1 Tax=Nocardia sp. NPDC052254 TaxID=3155681 RepID=UPI003430CAF0
MTSFIGRRREIDEARARLQHTRLLTVVGPGGVGKTRLADAVVCRSARAFRDPARWIELAAVLDPAALPSAAAAALGVTDQSNRPVMDKITDYLRDQNVLVVLDNCEHLLDAVASFVAGVLAAGAEIRVLATSRERLGVGGEVIFELPPLPTPTLSAERTAAELAPCESVALLVERAHDVVADFTIDDSNARAIAQLCIQLDGIPLAIELAAVRLRSLSPEQLVHRLGARFDVLTGGNRTDMPRQQTLRALIDWSFDLCTPAEKRLWARLSVFPGSFDLEAAEAVCTDPGTDSCDVSTILDQLIAKSLVGVDRSRSVPRYSQLMTVREYGHELLVAAGDEAAVRSRHRDHYLDRAERYARDWFSPHQSDLLEQMRIDDANLTAAFDRSLHDNHLDTAARLAVALRYHWIAGGTLADGRVRLERLLGQLTDAHTERGNVLWVTAWIALVQGDRDGAARHLDECADIALVHSDRRLQANHDQWAGVHAMFGGRHRDAIALYGRAIPVHREYGDPAALTASFQLAMAQAYNGQLDAALSTSAEVIGIADSCGERWNKAYGLWIGSIAHFHRGDIAVAVESAIQALRLQRDFKDGICTALSIEVLAWATAAENEHSKAARLFGAAHAVWQNIGTSVTAFGPDISADSEGAEQMLESSLGTEVFHRLTTPAAQLSIEQAVDLALERPARRPRAPRADTNPLTKREREVAGLIAQGLSNREIAATLIVSRRTVDGHVEHILDKLGVGSRTLVVAWLQAHNQDGVSR